MYADFEYYKSVYFGKEITSEGEFSRVSVRAAAYLKSITAGRIDKCGDDENIKLCFCALCDMVFIEPTNSGIQSESNDGYSVTYSAEKAKTLESRMGDICRLYLGGTGLLYRGV